MHLFFSVIVSISNNPKEAKKGGVASIKFDEPKLLKGGGTKLMDVQGFENPPKNGERNWGSYSYLDFSRFNTQKGG